MKYLSLVLYTTFFISVLGQTSMNLDPDFLISDGFNNKVNCIIESNDNKLIVGGLFNTYDGIFTGHLVKLNENGTIDNNFSTTIPYVINSIAVQNDNKIVVGSDYDPFTGTSYLKRFNIDGSLDTVFDSNISNSINGSIYSVLIQNDQKIIFAGEFTSYNGIIVNGIVRIHPNGMIDSTFNSGSGVTGIIQNMKVQNDGKIIIGGFFQSYDGFSRSNIARINNDGTIDQSFNPIGFNTYGYVFDMDVQSDGKIIAVGSFENFNGYLRNGIVRINTDGLIDLTFDPGNLFPACQIYNVTIDSSEDIIVGGNLLGGVKLFTPDGSINNLYDFGIGTESAVNSILLKTNNKLVLGGNFGLFNNTLVNRIAQLKSRPIVMGKVYNDINNNCILDSLEIGLKNIILTITPGNFTITTNINSYWYLDSLPAGNYTITIDTTNLNWTPTCPITQSFTVTNPNGFTDGPDFGLISTNPCSDPDVSIYAPTLRPCLPNQMIYVSACNQTTATGALNASYVDVELDPLMTVTGSSLSYTNQGNNIYRFQTDTLNPGQCVNFNIATTISSPTIGCAGLLGLTLCMDANLYPVQSCALDTIPSDPIINDGTGGTLNGFPQPCTLPWDQSSLSVDGWCQGDSVYFSITNTGEPGGGDMECYSPMWVTIDGVVTYTDSIMIPGGETIILSYFGNGQTWILNAEQHPLHPGNSHPNAHVEACGDTANWTPDNVNDFPQDDADPVVDIYCGVVTGSYDPNDKTGYPIGQTNQKYIQPNQQLQYVIRFQNTGTDTAFTVVIRDTLDTDLNIFTVTSGVSSHQYDFRMYGPRVLEWTFNNINLPDSTTDQEGSNGFVTFHVDQVPNLAPGTQITNDADIFFDFNDPITTNTTIHRIYEGFVSVLNVEELTQSGKSLLVYPNPTTHSITIKGEKNMNQSFSIYDQMGREVLKGKLNGISTEVNLSILSKGIYTLKIDGNYKPAQIVKE